jgi:HEAT repeat protein
MRLIPSLRARRAIATSLVLALSAWSVPASAGGSVRYSYEKIEIGGVQDYVLVPRAEPSIGSGKLSKSRVLAAFDALKKDKGGSYGKTTIEVGGSNDAPKVKVLIDPEFARFSLIIIAEAVYTFTELGVANVEFPGYAARPLTRADVPFSVYTLNVPLWKAVGQDVAPAQILLPDGRLIDAVDFNKRWAAKDADLQNALFAYLSHPQAYTVISVLQKLPGLGLPYTEQVAPLLSNADVLIRQKAIEALEPKIAEAPVATALAAALLTEKEDAVARQLAATLAKSKDPAFAVLSPLFVLERGKDEESAAAAAELASKFGKDQRVLPALVAQLGGKRASVAKAAADAIAQLDADAIQIAALDDEKIGRDLRLDIARDLAEDKDAPARLAGLNYIATNADERESLDAIERLVSGPQSDDVRKVIEAMLTSSQPYRRQAAASGLERIKSPASIEALARAIPKASPDDARAFEEAGYTIMLEQPLKFITEQTKASDVLVQRMAYRAIGERAAREKAGAQVMGTLKAGIASKDALIRGAAARALGAFANKESADLLKGLLEDKSPEVRRDVALALGNFTGGELAAELEKYLGDKEPTVVAAAIRAIGQRGEAAAWAKIKDMAKSPSGEVRAAVMFALSKLVNRQDKQAANEVISLLSGALSDKEVEVRREAITQLGTFPDENAVLAISAQLSAQEEPLRLAAIAAVANTGNSSGPELLEGLLEDQSVKIRRATITALGKFKGNKVARQALEARLKTEQDKELQELIKKTLKAV